MTDKYAGACWNELMENESKESLAEMYMDLLRRIARLEAENAALKAQVQRLSAPVSEQEWHDAISKARMLHNYNSIQARPIAEYLIASRLAAPPAKEQP